MHLSKEVKDLSRKCAEHIIKVGFVKNKLFNASLPRSSVRDAQCCMMGAAGYCSQNNPKASFLEVTSVMNEKNAAYKELILAISEVLEGCQTELETASQFSPADFNDDDRTDKQDVIDVFNFIANLPSEGDQ